MKNLENYGVLQLNTKEMEEIEGGDFGVVSTVVAGIIIGAAVEIMGDWDHFKKGFLSAF